MRSNSDLAPAVEACGQNLLVDYMRSKYKLPGAPERAKSARQIATAADIFGRMIEEDVGQKNVILCAFRQMHNPAR